MGREDCHTIADAIQPLIARIDAEILADRDRTMQRCIEANYRLSDSRAYERREWREHHERTAALKRERERIIKSAVRVIAHLSPIPIIITVECERVHP